MLPSNPMSMPSPACPATLCVQFPDDQRHGDDVRAACEALCDALLRARMPDGCNSRAEATQCAAAVTALLREWTVHAVVDGERLAQQNNDWSSSGSDDGGDDASPSSLACGQDAPISLETV